MQPTSHVHRSWLWVFCDVGVFLTELTIRFFIFFLVARGLVAIVAISVYAYHAVTVPPPWSIDGCVDTILDARVDQGLPSAHIPRPALSGSVQVERDGHTVAGKQSLGGKLNGTSQASCGTQYWPGI